VASSYCEPRRRIPPISSIIRIEHVAAARWIRSHAGYRPDRFGAIGKLVHNWASAIVGVALAEVMTIGIEAEVEPLELWERCAAGATGDKRAFDHQNPVWLPVGCRRRVPKWFRKMLSLTGDRKLGSVSLQQINVD
jgi:hypothetical protein